ncbi:V/A-type H+-transporting ATPase subunit C [Streptococcus rupicaprae]|uniref:V/A-type H+-transporting ATPase subunit C n=1 Tax=Streptococcus rupicaprae TaxID=759619 RepID=A0ABV2FJX1_9STRE
MDASLFSQVNTLISARESNMLTKAQFEGLLSAPDQEAMALVLQGTDYMLEAEDLSDPNRIEEVLMKHLTRVYRQAFEESPVQEVVQLFSLPYTYHNLKVLLKERATGSDLKQLLIPIGAYSSDVLAHLVDTLTSDVCPSIMQEEVAGTWAEYQDYQDIRVLDIGMDMAYFKHLNILSEALEQEQLKQFVALTVDFYNVTTVKRGLNQDKPRSFMRQLLSEEALFKARDYLRLFADQSLLSWFNQTYPHGEDLAVKPYEENLKLGTVSALQLEYLEDLLRFQILDQGRFETEGPLPLARYLYGKELEVKNLRLILTGRSNGLEPQMLKERMRPIYGQ